MKLKEYFSRENVVAVLGILSALIIFSFNKHSSLHEQTLNIYLQRNRQLDSIKDDYIEVIDIAKYTIKLDSLDRARGVNELDIYEDVIRKRNLNDIAANTFKLKRYIREDIAMFSKFKNINSGEVYVESFAMQNEFLIARQTLIDLLDEYAKAIYNNSPIRSELFTEMENAFLQWGASNKKIKAVIEDHEKINQRNEKAQNKIDQEFDKNIENLEKSSSNYLIVTAVVFYAWLNIFVLSIYFGTFKNAPK